MQKLTCDKYCILDRVTWLKESYLKFGLEKISQNYYVKKRVPKSVPIGDA
jgi:hypothetical protein